MDKMMVDNLSMLSTTEVAALLRCGRHHVEFLHKSGILPYCKVAGKRWTRESDLLAYQEAGGDPFTEAAYKRNPAKYGGKDT